MRTETKKEMMCDILEVSEGIKPACVFLSEKYEEILEMKIESNKKGLWVVSCNCHEDKEDNEHFIIFIKEKENALRFSYLINHFNLTDLQMRASIGKLIGIPECCLLNFVKNKGNYKKMYKNYRDQFLPRMHDRYGLEYSPKLKYDPKMEGVGHTNYIFFIPCCPFCKKTKEIYTKNKNFWESDQNERGCDNHDIDRRL